MKKGFALFCILLFVCVTLTASAQTIQPQTSPLILQLLAGKSFTARLNGCTFSDENMSDAMLEITIYERDEFAAEDIQKLQVDDEIVYGNLSKAPVASVLTDEFGVTINVDTPYTAVYFYELENGSYIAIDEDEHAHWHELFTLSVPADSGVIYRDWSDPEADVPTDRTFAELVEDIANDVLFYEENTTVTFDDAGKLIIVLRNYSPWN